MEGEDRIVRAWVLEVWHVFRCNHEWLPWAYVGVRKNEAIRRWARGVAAESLYERGVTRRHRGTARGAAPYAGGECEQSRSPAGRRRQAARARPQPQHHHGQYAVLGDRPTGPRVASLQGVVAHDPPAVARSMVEPLDRDHPVGEAHDGDRTGPRAAAVPDQQPIALVQRRGHGPPAHHSDAEAGHRTRTGYEPTGHQRWTSRGARGCVSSSVAGTSWP